MKFENFTIYGERCSGTNFLRKLMYDNFNLNLIYLPNKEEGWKHFFGSETNKESIRASTNCIILCIVRNPIDYLCSFFKYPHHQPEERKVNFEAFLTSEFYSLGSQGDLIFDTYMCEGNRRYKDIFEMRSVKNRFLFLNIPLLTFNSYFIRYEDLKIRPNKTLSSIEFNFGLDRKYPEFVVESKRVGPQEDLDNGSKFQLLDMSIMENYSIGDSHIKEIIKTRLNFETESMVGYDKNSIIERLK
jgi:hypothetical protein